MSTGPIRKAVTAIVPPPPPPPPKPPAPQPIAQASARSAQAPGDRQAVGGGRQPSHLELGRLPGVKPTPLETAIAKTDQQRLVDTARNTRTPATEWTSDRPLAEARNEHLTNTRDEMLEGLTNGANFFEGDVRTHDGRPVMAHDKGDAGDGLSLDQWLEAGGASGRGLKMDFKDNPLTGETVQNTIQAIKQAGVPDERLMFNTGNMDALRQFREAFPKATLALGMDKPEHVDAVLGKARALEKAFPDGGPITFPVKDTAAEPGVIAKLKGENRTVSIWNNPKDGKLDIGDRTAELRRLGVDGMIDLRNPKHESFLDKINPF